MGIEYMTKASVSPEGSASYLSLTQGDPSPPYCLCPERE